MRTTQLGDLGVAHVAADLVRRGYAVSLPFGSDCAYDLVVDRAGRLERVQVKTTRSDGRRVVVKCCSTSSWTGKTRAVRRYTAADVEWIAAFDATTRRCFYVPAAEFGDGRRTLNLRLAPPTNGQRTGIRDADAYAEI